MARPRAGSVARRGVRRKQRACQWQDRPTNAVDLVVRAGPRGVGVGRHDLLGPRTTPRSPISRDPPLHRASGHLDAGAAEGEPHLPGAVKPAVGGPDLPDLLSRPGVALRPRRQARGITLGSLAFVPAGRGDRQRPADRPSPAVLNRWRPAGPAPYSSRNSSMNAIICGTGGRASQASLEAMPRCLRSWAKTSVRQCLSDHWRSIGSPFFRISLACRSSRTSRSSSLMRALSALVGPASLPASRRACL